MLGKVPHPLNHHHTHESGSENGVSPSHHLYMYQIQKKKGKIDLPCLEQKMMMSRNHLLIQEEEAVCFFFRTDLVMGQLIEVCLKILNVLGSYYHEDQSPSRGVLFLS